MLYRTTLLATVVAAMLVPFAAAQDDAPAEDTFPETLENPEHADVQIVGHVVEPQKDAPASERLDQLKLPDGFKISVFAEDLGNARMIAVADDGTVYVTRRKNGDVLMLKDTDGDGTADDQKSVASKPGMHGIAIDGDTVYLATVKEVFKTNRHSDGTFAELQRIISDLPDGGQHPNRTLAMGPDDKLYISVGSSCNACPETNPEHATILQAEPDGSSRTIFASGLRNTIGFGFHPETGELYGMDHGTDWLGDNEQHEELNHIRKGDKYGWPYIYTDGNFHPGVEPPDVTLEEWAEQSVEPIGLYTPHAAPMQWAYYTADQFPEEYRGDAFIAMRGSWNRKPPAGYEVVRIKFEDNKPAAFEPFVQGFVSKTFEGDWAHHGRLAGLAVAQDGALLFTDDVNGVIYRVAYTGERNSNEEPGEPTNLGAASVSVNPQSN